MRLNIKQKVTIEIETDKKYEIEINPYTMKNRELAHEMVQICLDMARKSQDKKEITPAEFDGICSNLYGDICEITNGEVYDIVGDGVLEYTDLVGLAFEIASKILEANTEKKIDEALEDER